MRLKIPRGAPPLLFVALLLVLLAACDGCKVEIGPPDPPPPNNTFPTSPPKELPPITQTGAGTIGCKINGEVWTFWIPPVALTTETGAQVSENDGFGTSYIFAKLWRKLDSATIPDKLSIGFSYQNPNLLPLSFLSTGKGSLTSDQFRFRLLYIDENKWYFPDTAATLGVNGLYIDYLDTGGNVISGRFNTTLYRGQNYQITDFNDSLIITDGRFDFIYDSQ